MKKIFYVFDRLSGTRLWMFYYDMSPFSQAGLEDIDEPFEDRISFPPLSIDAFLNFKVSAGIDVLSCRLRTTLRICN